MSIIKLNRIKCNKSLFKFLGKLKLLNFAFMEYIEMHKPKITIFIFWRGQTTEIYDKLEILQHKKTLYVYTTIDLNCTVPPHPTQSTKDIFHNKVLLYSQFYPESADSTHRERQKEFRLMDLNLDTQHSTFDKSSLEIFFRGFFLVLPAYFWPTSSTTKLPNKM